MTEPLYRPFRRIMPDFGGLDLTPMLVLILVIIIDGPVLRYAEGMATCPVGM
ncbi:MAG: YggT family protein [Sphingopyxis sp.]|uniref:YggT family protein n=1 Tax=Sphingopyxis sp. TaxID=1908224 RepID=UPI004036D7BF